MNKELEILERAKHDLSTLKDLKLEGHTTTIFRTTGYDHLKEALELLEAKLTPTADEVCKALSMWYGCEDMHNNKEHDDINESYIRDSFYRVKIKKDMDDKPYKVRHEIVAGGSDGITMNAWLPPHLITLIGRFYEGLGKEE